MKRILLVLVLGVQASAARADWAVDDRGDCVRVWSPASLARGPAAMLNAPLLPFRSLAGGIQIANDDRVPGLRRKVLLTPLLAVGGAVMGVLEAAIWLGTGLADTLTAGYFTLAPEEATELSLAPERPPFLSDSPAPRATSTDPCGRPRRG